MNHLSEQEKQQLLFDWRYKGVSILNLLTESEVDLYAEELERIRIQRQKTIQKVNGVIMTHLCIHIKNQNYLLI